MDEAPAVPMAPTDEDLLLRTEAGDASAAAVLFDRHSDLIFTIGLRVLRDRGEAEDLVQEVFLGLVKKVRGFDPGKGSGRTWIIQIAYRRAFDRRAYLTRRSFYGGTDLERMQNTLEGRGGLEAQVLDVLTGEQLHAAFDELNEKQRVTLELYFFEGLDLREISERLTESLENTRHHYYRGLERLRKNAIGMAHRHRK